LRPARVGRASNCTEDPLDDYVGTLVPCYMREDVADVFDEETGRLLGEVEFPTAILEEEFSVPFIRGDELYAVIEDDAGTIMVKRYRLVLPGEE
jgi:hypothetical protein